MFGFILGAAAVGAIWYFWPKIKVWYASVVVKI